MLRLLKSFFKPKEPPSATGTPYKVETPAPVAKPEPAKCGCGRSSTGYCVGLHKLSQAEWEQHSDNPAKPVAEAKPAKKKAAPKKAAAMKAPAKPRAPRKPKAN